MKYEADVLGVVFDGYISEDQKTLCDEDVSVKSENNFENNQDPDTDTNYIKEQPNKEKIAFEVQR